MPRTLFTKNRNLSPRPLRRRARARVVAAKAALDAAETRPLAASNTTSSERYWAVIFTSRLASADGYGAMATAMEELAAKQPGYLGMESARGEDGLGITVSYWASLAAISSWKSHIEHRDAQVRGRSSFYDRYEVRICSVERSYRFSKDSEGEQSHGLR